MTVEEVMHRGVEAVSTDLPVRELGRYLVSRRISGAPVVDASNHPVGVVSLADLTAHAMGLERTRASRYLTDLNEPRFHEAPELGDLPDPTTARDLMTTFLVRVAEDTPVHEVVEVIIKTGIHRVFVTREGQLTGVVTTMDLMRLLGSMLEKQRKERAV